MQERRKNKGFFVTWYALSEEAHKLIELIPAEGFQERPSSPDSNKELKDSWWFVSETKDDIIITKRKEGFIVQSSTGAVPCVLDITPNLRIFKEKSRR